MKNQSRKSLAESAASLKLEDRESTLLRLPADDPMAAVKLKSFAMLVSLVLAFSVVSVAQSATEVAQEKTPDTTRVSLGSARWQAHFPPWWNQQR
jgi:hypothetical protein